MLEIQDVEKLAKLARIELTLEEKQKLLKEVDPILDYVNMLKGAIAKLGEEKKAGELRNVTRNDIDVRETGINTKNIVANMPESQNNYLKVKKIL